MTWAAARRFVGGWAVASTAAWVIARSVGGAAPGTPPAEQALTLALVSSLAAHWLPGPRVRRPEVQALGAAAWGGAVALGAGFPFWAAGSLTVELLARAAAGAGCSLFLLEGAAGWLERVWGDRPAARTLALGAFAVLAGSPLWLAPAAELWGGGPPVTDAVLAISPTGYLAALLDHDLLRGDWFYRHCPLGSLRYSYPSAAVATVAWLLLGLLFCRLPPHGRSPGEATPGRQLSSRGGKV